MKNRVSTIDVLRSITMFFMLFVNDIPGLKGVPQWLFHAAGDEDMLGFSDIIFPCFLFCVGMSVPLALESRFKKGDTVLQILTHILVRTFSLVVMGLFTLNCVSHGVLSTSMFMLLMSIGFIMTWIEGPVFSARRTMYAAIRGAGALILAALLVYADVSGSPFHTGWWGILGLIGWTYLVVSVVYLFTRKSLKANVVVALAAILLCVLNNTNIIPQEYFSRCILLPFIPGGWTHHALAFCGVVSTQLILKYAKDKPYNLIGLFASFANLSVVLGVICHRFWIVSKIYATPTWLFFCLGIFFCLLIVIFWLTDIKGKSQWFNFLKPAGTATLTCYIVPYVWYALKGLFGLTLPDGVYYGITGILVSLLFSYIVIWIVGFFLKWGVKLKI